MPLSRECQTVNYALRTIKETGKFLLDASSSPSLSALLRLQEVFLSVSLSLKLASQLQSEHRTLLCPLTFRQQRFGGHLCVTSTRRTRLPYTLMMNGTGAGNKGFIGTKQ